MAAFIPALLNVRNTSIPVIRWLATNFRKGSKPEIQF